MKEKIVAIIPARGGSKGVPRKNIRILCGKPLLAYSIEAALDSKLVTRTIVSTEDEEIATISKEIGADVFVRSTELANDTVSASDVVIDVGENLVRQGDTLDVLIMLQPTSPLRTSLDIDNALRLFIESECDSVVSVVKEEHSPFWSLKIVDNYLEPVFGYEFLKKTRQDIPTIYKPNGAIFVAALETLKRFRSFYCKRIMPYIMPYERSVDIDSEIDLRIAELFIQGRHDAK